MGLSTELFGLAGAFCSIGDTAAGPRLWQRITECNTFTIVTTDGADRPGGA